MTATWEDRRRDSGVDEIVGDSGVVEIVGDSGVDEVVGDNCVDEVVGDLRAAGSDGNVTPVT